MKEAAGEANITVITIVLIGVVAAVGVILIPRLLNNTKAKACCTDHGGIISGKYCVTQNRSTGEYDSNFILGSNSFKNSDRFSACMAD